MQSSGGYYATIGKATTSNNPERELITSKIFSYIFH
jgi:hypothetical protein